jgi:hypothetical protein
MSAPEDWTPEMLEAAHRAAAEIDAALVAARTHRPDNRWQAWLVDIPEHTHDGVVVERFIVSEQEAAFDQLRAAINHQRPNRAIQPGVFTRLKIDGEVWMTDTPAEVADLWDVDDAMRREQGGTVLIVGLGIGLVVRRAIVEHAMSRIDVVEIDWRIIDAVAPHYDALARDHGITLNIHRADIHEWRAPRGRVWDVGWFDIWDTISTDDMAEVKRLRDRFRKRLGWFGAWAQYDRIQANKRVRTGHWAY